MKKPLIKSFVTKFIAGMGILTLFPMWAGAQWVQTNGPTTGGAVQALAVSGNNLFAGTARSGIFITSDSGDTWTAVNYGLTDTNILCLAADSSTIFAGTSGKGVFFSNNNGANWVAINSGLTDTIIQCLGTSNSRVLAGTKNKGIFVSINRGTSWTVSNSGLTQSNIWSLLLDGAKGFLGIADNSYLSPFSGLCNGVSSRSIFCSADSGTNWNCTTKGYPYSCGCPGSPGCVVSSVGVRSFAGLNGYLFAGTNGVGIYRSLNIDSLSWTQTNSGLTQLQVYAFAAIDTELFAGTNGGGVYLSTNNGSLWVAYNSGLTDFFIRSLAVGNSNLFAGTNSTGVWRLQLTQSGTAIKQQFSPPGHVSFKLLSRGHSLSIDFSLPHSSPVTINVYTLSGHLVATLCDKPMAAGSHSVSWDTRNAASGCYMIRMQAGATTQVKAVPLFR